MITIQVYGSVATLFFYGSGYSTIFEKRNYKCKLSLPVLDLTDLASVSLLWQPWGSVRVTARMNAIEASNCSLSEGVTERHGHSVWAGEEPLVDYLLS